MSPGTGHAAWSYSTVTDKGVLDFEKVRINKTDMSISLINP